MSRLDTIAPRRWQRAGWVITTDAGLIDAAAVQRHLADGKQSPDIPLSVVEAFIANSVNFGMFDSAPEDGARMVGYARVVTDFAAFAYIGDLFLIDDDHRGQGRGTWLMECVLEHPDLQELRRWTLMCGPRPVDWYKRFGFVEPERPGFALHRTDRTIYRRAAGSIDGDADEG
ncbi:MAG: GNAT family N-acetyltransferase [Alphaproteobacteria bacterium]|nr:GNAT family N-acetyltransferase [Alphaproteobacteria bacterium]